MVNHNFQIHKTCYYMLLSMISKISCWLAIVWFSFSGITMAQKKPLLEYSLDESKVFTIGQGKQFRVQMFVHGSVGFTAAYEISDEQIVEFLESEIKYRKSDAERKGKTGADAADKVFTFKALSPGKATITLKQSYRGEPKDERRYQIEVVE